MVNDELGIAASAGDAARRAATRSTLGDLIENQSAGGRTVDRIDEVHAGRRRRHWRRC